MTDLTDVETSKTDNINYILFTHQFNSLIIQEKREVQDLSHLAYLTVVPQGQLSPHKQGLQLQFDS